MIKIDAKEAVLDLDGNKVMIDDKTAYSVGKAMSRAIMGNPTSPDPLKAYVIAKSFNDEKVVELNETEKSFVETLVKGSNASPLVKGFLLNELSKETEEKATPKAAKKK